MIVPYFTYGPNAVSTASGYALKAPNKGVRRNLDRLPKGAGQEGARVAGVPKRAAFESAGQIEREDPSIVRRSLADTRMSCSRCLSMRFCTAMPPKKQAKPSVSQARVFTAS